MSSAKSPALTPTDLHDTLQAALIEVGENAYFVFVEACAAAAFATLAEQERDKAHGAVVTWLMASVRFSGAFSGSVEIVLPERLGRWLVSSLLGMTPDEELPESQVFDGVGEFANMVCGAWLSRVGDQALFELKVPAVTRMAAEWNPVADGRGREEVMCRMVSLNDSPMRIRVRAQ
ncbi:MAG TPA: chemotaxis protein CheX [Vicinamibacterales bacterium]|jgi:CheY-specific phosphatase CheX|nr:chemotaxis protein CheX [Vicinamibacterales bacterium]